MMENWRPIKGYDGLYEVSDLGNVRSIGLRKCVMHPSLTHKRPTVNLWKNRKRQTFLVYRLVLEAFIGPCPAGMEACHRDGNSLNSCLDNLRWDTKQANFEDDRRNGVRRGAQLWPEAVRIIKAEPKRRGMEMELARAFGVSRGQIKDIRAGRYWKHIS